MHSEYPREKVPAYGKKYSCKGNFNEKLVQFENSPPSPHNFTNGPSLIDKYTALATDCRQGIISPP